MLEKAGSRSKSLDSVSEQPSMKIDGPIWEGSQAHCSEQNILHENLFLRHIWTGLRLKSQVLFDFMPSHLGRFLSNCFDGKKYGNFFVL